MEWSLPGVFDAVSTAAPGRDVLVWKDVRRSYTEVASRTRSLAAFLAGRGLGVRRERAALERWECGQSTVALLLYNCPEYVEAMLGCFRARAVPFNVNQHYRPEEIRRLLDMVGAEAAVYHRALGPLLEAAGEDLNYGTLQAAGEGLGELSIPGDPSPRTYGPGTAADGDPASYLFTWDADRDEYVLRED